MAEEEKGIVITDRENSPFRQLYNGQSVGYDEGSEEKALRENQIQKYQDDKIQRQLFLQRQAEIDQQKREEATNLGIDPDSIETC